MRHQIIVFLYIGSLTLSTYKLVHHGHRHSIILRYLLSPRLNKLINIIDLKYMKIKGEMIYFILVRCDKQGLPSFYGKAD